MKQLIGLSRQFKAGTARVFIVSYPRSGHHALIGFLNKVSDFADDYCEYYSCTKHNGKPIPCHYADAERSPFSFECGAGNAYIKNHDFRLALPFYEDRKYIVQYRHPFLSIKSWFEMESDKNKELPDWEVFFAQKLKFWKGFINKWVIKHGNKPNVRLVPYDSLSDLQNVISLAKFADATLKPNMDNVHHKFSPKRHVESSGSLRTLEHKLLPLLNAAKITPLYVDSDQ